MATGSAVKAAETSRLKRKVTSFQLFSTRLDRLGRFIQAAESGGGAVVFHPPHVRKYHRWSCAAHQKTGRGPAEGHGID